MKDFDTYFKETGEIGYVESIISSIFYVSGLPNVRLGELVITENGLIGIVKTILEDLVEVMVFEGKTLLHKMKVVRTNEYFQVPVSNAFLGRVINPFGVAQDNLEPILENRLTYRPVDPPAPGIGQRVRIKRFFETGVMAVDLLIPLGYGQRELVLGDAKTGKTTFVLQTIVNQANHGTICVYVSCGKKKSDLKFVESYLKEMNVLAQVVIVAASSSDPAPMVYLAPLAGLSIAEHFRDQGREVAVIIDDMTTHAKFYREIALLSRRPPGRQSYPGDIFHIHAKIAERAGNIMLEDGREASITFLPVAETLEGDLSAYIQTNLMAMTDGHLFYDVDQVKKGVLPAVSFTLSVSRVGNQTKTPLEREIAANLTLRLAQARKAEELGRFGVELTAETMKAIENAERIEALFKQDAKMIIPKNAQIILAGLFIVGFWDKSTQFEIHRDKKLLLAAWGRGNLDRMRLKIDNTANLGSLCDLIKKEISGIKTLLGAQDKNDLLTSSA